MLRRRVTGGFLLVGAGCSSSLARTCRHRLVRMTEMHAAEWAGPSQPPGSSRHRSPVTADAAVVGGTGDLGQAREVTGGLVRACCCALVRVDLHARGAVGPDEGAD